MVPEDPWAELAVAREKRLVEVEADLHAAQAGNGMLAQTQAAQGKELDALHQQVRDLREDVGTIREGQRTLIMVLVGFAFTVAGSAIGLALALGGHA